MVPILLPFLSFLVACGHAASVPLATQLQPSNPGTPLVPWLQPSSWVPAYASLSNDLEALLKLRASTDRWVTLYLFALPANSTGSAEERSFLRLALNTLFTYRVFGSASFDLLGALNGPALELCRSYRLPCFNASRYAEDAGSMKKIGWAKVKLTRDVLKLGYNVHLSDLDVSYLKPIDLAIQEVFSWSNNVADGSMMQEEWVYQDDPGNAATRRPIYLANTGVVFLRANERNVKFMESLLRWESDKNQDQYVATLVAYESWAPCQEEAACLAVRNRGMAAITRHPAQFAHSNCEPEPRYSHCATRRLYVHAVCRATSVDKEGFLRWTKAMFISADGVPTTAAAGAVAGAAGGSSSSREPAVMGRQDNAAIMASGLPCPARQQRAWSERFYTSYTTVESAVGASGAGMGSEGAAAAGAAAAKDVKEADKAEDVAARMDVGAAVLAAQQLQEGSATSSSSMHTRSQQDRKHRPHLRRLMLRS